MFLTNEKWNGLWHIKNKAADALKKTTYLYTKVVKKQFGLRKMMGKSCFFGRKITNECLCTKIKWDHVLKKIGS